MDSLDIGVTMAYAPGLDPYSVKQVVAGWVYDRGPEGDSRGVVFLTQTGYAYVAVTREFGPYGRDKIVILVEKTKAEPTHLYTRASNWEYFDADHQINKSLPAAKADAKHGASSSSYQ